VFEHWAKIRKGQQDAIKGCEEGRLREGKELHERRLQLSGIDLLEFQGAPWN
jgi:hypothetical protein